MNPFFIILVAGFEIEVELCTLPNPIGEPCNARVTNMLEHRRWHAIRDAGAKIVCFCRAGQHEYLKSVTAPPTLNCQKHIEKMRRGQEKGKRMLSKGQERHENIRAA